MSDLGSLSQLCNSKIKAGTLPSGRKQERGLNVGPLEIHITAEENGIHKAIN